MKKYLFCIFFTISGLSLFSQNLIEKINIPEGIITPLRSYTNQRCISVYNESTHEAEIYDLNFNCLAILSGALRQQGFADHSDGVNNKVEVTQTFFNDDDKFEYFVTSNPNDVNKWWGIKNSSGVFLYKEDVLIVDSAFMFEFEYDSNSSSRFFVVDGRLYKVNKGSGNVIQSVSKGTTEAYPNPVKRGDNFTIELPNENADNKLILVVSDINGVMQYRQDVNGSSKVDINTGRFDCGTYIYSVIKDGVNIKAGKIIIK